MFDLLADGNIPFAVAITLMLMIGLIEAVSLFSGFSISSAIDNLVPDFDMPDGVDGAPADGGFLANAFSWLSIGKVPALILLVLFLFSFGVSGYLVQGFWSGLTGHLLDGKIAAIPATIAGLVGMSRLGALVGRILPKDHTQATRESELLGGMATIIRGEARLGDPAEAKILDLSGNTHYLLVEPDDPDTVLKAGDTAPVIRLRPGSNAIYQTSEFLPAVKA